MTDLKVFIASSGASAGVADLIANRLQRTSKVRVRVWDEGVFTLNQGVLDRLLTFVNEYDFAIMIWGPDDVTESKGVSEASPRDNVVFECGLFMGTLGKDRVFIVHDRDAKVKVPSDFAAITLATYEGSRVKEEGESAIRSACDKIAAEIAKPRQSELVGTWRSHFVMNADVERRQVIDELMISAAPDGIYIDGLSSKLEPYSASGKVYKNQVIGKWQHKSGENFVDGTFMLVVGPRANIMYGYCTGRDENDAMIFATWVLAKKGKNDDEIARLMSWGQQALKDRTIAFPLERQASSSSQLTVSALVGRWKWQWAEGGWLGHLDFSATNDTLTFVGYVQRFHNGQWQRVYDLDQGTANILPGNRIELACNVSDLLYGGAFSWVSAEPLEMGPVFWGRLIVPPEDPRYAELRSHQWGIAITKELS